MAPKTVKELIAYRGDWVEKAIFALQSLPYSEVIGYFATLDQVQDYLRKNRIELRDSIMEIIAHSKKWKWQDTGSAVVTDNDFVEYYLEQSNKSFKKLKSELKTLNISNDDLICLHKKIVESPEFYY